MEEIEPDDVPPVAPIVHILLVGFHHQYGPQIEYAYPPMASAGAPDVDPKNRDRLIPPPEWKFLPFLALPDGAHNSEEDFTYFHVPALESGQEAGRTYFAVACYRQIASSELKNVSKDVTRNHVQKAVVVLSRLPLYGLIRTKLAVITRTLFEQRDFSNLEILRDFFHTLTNQLSQRMDESHLYIGLSTSDLVRRFHHRTLTLFKLLLLEKKVVFYSAQSVHNLCTSLVSLASMLPGALEKGPMYSALI
eukprot:Opistho-1_new@22190